MLKSNELKVGFLALITFLILYFGFNFLKGNDLFTSAKYYYVSYDHVDGLLPSNSVMLNGVEVGKVRSVEMQAGSNNRILVTLRVNSKLLLPKQSKAVLADGALLGGKIIRLDLAGTGSLPDGAHLPGLVEQGLTTLLKERAIPVLSNADSLLISFRVISKKFENTGTQLNALLKNSNTTVGNLNGAIGGLMEDNRQNLSVISGNLKTLSSNLIETERQLKPMLGKFNTLADSLNALQVGKTLQGLNASVQSLQVILKNLEKGEGSAGKLLKSDSLYLSLNQTIRDLDRLLIDFRIQPKRYVNISVFGKKTPPPSQ